MSSIGVVGAVAQLYRAPEDTFQDPHQPPLSKIRPVEWGQETAHSRANYRSPPLQALFPAKEQGKLERWLEVSASPNLPICYHPTSPQISAGHPTSPVASRLATQSHALGSDLGSCTLPPCTLLLLPSALWRRC